MLTRQLVPRAITTSSRQYAGIHHNFTRQSKRTLVTTRNSFIKISEEVQQALSEKKPVVALESTIYTHGFPYPENALLASRLETLVRLHGGVPATIGVLEGIPRIGFKADELSRLISANQTNTLKVSRRDLGFACALKDAEGRPYNGGTTVSGTMVLAHLAGIQVFATGGLGGVHRGAEQTMDISADLTELGRTPVAVISSGCKSFLDLAKTLEYLETQGVAVATFADGRTGPIDVPAFYTRDSGIRSPITLEDEYAAARVIHASSSLNLQSGMLFANPIPEAHSIPLPEMEIAIAQAIQEAEAAGATGAKSTPFILAKIKELTGDKSLEANKALVEANVIRGTKVSVALSELQAQDKPSTTTVHQVASSVMGPGAQNYTREGVSKGLAAGNASGGSASESQLQSSLPSQDLSVPTVYVAGSLAVDLSCDFVSPKHSHESSPALHTSNIAEIQQSLGGVGHNVARAAQLVGASVKLCSIVGDDLAGKAALKALVSEGLSEDGVVTLSNNSAARTAQYVAVNDANKDLVLAMADMSILDGEDLSAVFEESWLPSLQEQKPSHIVIDANWAPEHLSTWLIAAQSIQAHVSFEPVSVAKSTSLFRLPSAHTLPVYPKAAVDLVTPNIHELQAMHEVASSQGFLARDDWWAVVNAFGIPHSGARAQLAMATSAALVDQGVPQQSLQLLPFFPTICAKLGSQGLLLAQIIPAGDDRLSEPAYSPYILSRCPAEEVGTTGVGGVYMRLFPTPQQIRPEDIVSVNGVGDSFAGTLIAGLAKVGRQGGRVEALIDVAQRAAALTLKSAAAVSPRLETLRIPS